ncbi:MAG: hypothetical protein JW703_01775 [Candidatus Diapherotrites archaeon]|nr:hypothetical protein [Candidatus Diapherotrites archaeon]
MFEIKYEKEWDKYFSKLDNSEKQKIWKKIQELKTIEKTRHLKFGLPFFVIETGQYRICFREKENNREIAFAGNHKQYEKWLKEQ